MTSVTTNEIESLAGYDRNQQVARSMKLSRIIRNRVRTDNRFASKLIALEIDHCVRMLVTPRRKFILTINLIRLSQHANLSF